METGARLQKSWALVVPPSTDGSIDRVDTVKPRTIMSRLRASLSSNSLLYQRVKAIAIKFFKRFQYEATKLGRTVIFQVTVFEKKERNKARLYAETQCYDPLQFLIQFVIRDAPDLDAVIDRFTQQLIHRGFSPMQFRVKNDNGTWGTWSHIEAA